MFIEGHRAVRAGAGLILHSSTANGAVPWSWRCWSALRILRWPSARSGPNQRQAWVSRNMASLPLPAIIVVELASQIRRQTIRAKRDHVWLVPMGIGAIIGAIGDHGWSAETVRNARRHCSAPAGAGDAPAQRDRFGMPASARCQSLANRWQALAFMGQTVHRLPTGAAQCVRRT